MGEPAAAGQLLELMLEDMRTADPLYRPTRFWELGLPPIVADLRKLGFRDFRSHPSARWYVGSFAEPWYREHVGLVRPLFKAADLLSGSRRIGARARRIVEGMPMLEREYDVFVASQDERSPRLIGISESDVGRPFQQLAIDGVKVGKNFLNYMRGLSFLKRRVDLETMPRVFEIGGGFGSLGEIVLKMSDRTFYLDVDIPPIAAVATYYLREIFGRDAVFGYDQCRGQGSIDIESLASKYRAAVLCPWQLPNIVGKMDLFVNFISFQEMEPHVVRNYARLASRMTRKCVLLRNSRDGQARARGDSDLGVLEPIRMDDAIGMFTDFEVAARDAGVFGNTTWDGSRVSELACLVRV
jgi:putative sugar O-methyltransferase